MRPITASSAPSSPTTPNYLPLAAGYEIRLVRRNGPTSTLA
nr:hypothetical protein [Tessaracoccus bendigoensis]